MEVAANARLMIENLFDLTHFYPLHAGNIGSLADARVPVEIERGERGGVPYLKTIRRRSNFTLPPMTRDRFGLEVADQLQEHTMVGPGLFHVVVTVAPPGRLGHGEEQGFVLYQTITPRDESNHIWRRSNVLPGRDRVGRLSGPEPGRRDRVGRPHGDRAGPLGSRRAAEDVRLPG